MKKRIVKKEKIDDLQSTNLLMEKLVYTSSDGVLVVGYVVRPRNQTGFLPCIIFNRGGYKEFGQITSYLLKTWLAQIARWGYVVIASQYRGNEGMEGKDEYGGADIADVLSLKDILEELPGSDTSRIGMIGFSRGGMMTYLALTRVRWIRAAIVLSGIADLERMLRDRPKMKKIMQEAFGGTHAAMKTRSALSFTKRISKKTPVLIVHGAYDQRVNPQDALKLSKIFLIHHLPHRLILYEKAGHELTEVEKEVWKEVRLWLKRFV